jgi:hypothetical protein
MHRFYIWNQKYSHIYVYDYVKSGSLHFVFSTQVVSLVWYTSRKVVLLVLIFKFKMKGTINNNGRMSQKQTITYPVLCYDVLSVTQLRPTQELINRKVARTKHSTKNAFKLIMIGTCICIPFSHVVPHPLAPSIASVLFHGWEQFCSIGSIINLIQSIKILKLLNQKFHVIFNFIRWFIIE